jgi:hypothetical protein
MPKRKRLLPLGVRRIRALAADPKALLELADAQWELDFIPLRKRLARLRLAVLGKMADEKIAAKRAKSRKTENEKTRRIVFPKLKPPDFPPLILRKKSKRRRRSPPSRPRER